MKRTFTSLGLVAALGLAACGSDTPSEGGGRFLEEGEEIADDHDHDGDGKPDHAAEDHGHDHDHDHDHKDGEDHDHD